MIRVHPKLMDRYLHDLVFDHFYLFLEWMSAGKWEWVLRVSAGRWVLKDVGDE